VAVFNFPLPAPLPAAPEPDDIVRHARSVSAWASRVNRGKTSNLGEITLTQNVASTTLTDERLTVGSAVLFDPMTANAATELYGATMYVLTADRTNGSFVITHANNAQTDRTFRYIIVG